MTTRNPLTLGLYFSIVIALVVLASGCGKKGFPIAPELAAPSPVGAIKATGVADGVVLNWNGPSQTAEKKELSDLRRFRVIRSLSPRGEVKRSFERIADIDVAETTMLGSPFSYKDRTAVDGQRYDYQVIPVNADGLSSQDNKTVRIDFRGVNSLVEIF